MASSKNCSGDTEMKFSSIFKSLDAVKKCLNSEKYVSLPEVQELLRIFRDNYSNVNDEVIDRSQRKVFIVLEGIDASGKTTIGKKLANMIHARQLSTPPALLLGLRDKFDAHEMELRRAYYALGNYLAAEQVKKAFKEAPVIMDRFWHSTASYAIAQQVVENYNGTMPPEGHEVYDWPADLLKPDIVFFLSVSESKRLDRLLRRKNKTITREELKMKDDKALRDALLQANLQMSHPPDVCQIYADSYPNKLVDVCVKKLLKHELIKESQLKNPDKYKLPTQMSSPASSDPSRAVPNLDLSNLHLH